MRDANASVSNYFHILWRKFSLEGPKTNFQPKRNETKMLQLQLRSTTTATTATIKPAATEATNLKKASRLLHRKILFFTPLPATWRKREGEKKTRQELNATSKKGGKKQETRNMVKTKRQPARQAGRQHQQWTCATTIKTNLSQPTRRLHVARTRTLSVAVYLSICECLYVSVAGGFLVGLTRTDVGKKRQTATTTTEKEYTISFRNQIRFEAE